jgi:hypothetical protein
LNKATVEPEEIASIEVENTKMNKNSILTDRLPTNSVERLNETLMNSRNALKNVEASPMYEKKNPDQMGGSLYGQLLLASQKMATPAALFLAATSYKKRKSKNKSRKIKSKSRKTKSKSKSKSRKTLRSRR